MLGNKKYKNLQKAFDRLQRAFDALYDPYTSRGASSYDKTQRLIGRENTFDNKKNLGLYMSNGFIQNIVESPAEDSTREWINIKTNLDVEGEESNIGRAILTRLDELNVQDKLTDLIRYSRMFSKGSLIYYAVTATNAVDDQLAEPLPEEIDSIKFMNVVDDAGLISFKNKNNSDPTKEDYNSIQVSLGGKAIHESRYSWLVNSWIPQKMTGISVIQTVSDAIMAQDNALWSIANILMTLSLNVLKSDDVADLDATQKGELLAKIKHFLITQSTLALKTDEEFDQIRYEVRGMKDLLDFVIDNMSGLSKMPKNILFGKAHGVVTAGEYDTLNYYANISRFQEIKLYKILEKIIDLVIKEKKGDVYNQIKGNIDDFDYEIEFNSLWNLDPLSQSDKDLKDAQRDQIDITVGKVAPSEARDLDPRYSELEPFEINRNPIDLTQPDQDEPGNQDADE